ncbi:MAG: hypothetical protein V8R00_09030 [Coprococcus catus]
MTAASKMHPLSISVAAFGEDMLSEETYEQCVQICRRIQREIEKK